MSYKFEPQLHSVKLASLRPTQMTVGMIEVERKRFEWRDHAATDGADFLGRHMIPVVIGPGQRPWLIDHHHLARALLDEGVEHILVSIVAQLDRLDKHGFLTFMDNRNWLHTFDAKGDRRAYDDLPRKLTKLTDDPYRSLAGELRRRGGYAKSEAPYAEFLWADFLRHRIGAKLIERDFNRAVAKASVLAHDKAASHLPGWCGED